MLTSVAEFDATRVYVIHEMKVPDFRKTPPIRHHESSFRTLQRNRAVNVQARKRPFRFIDGGKLPECKMTVLKLRQQNEDPALTDRLSCVPRKPARQIASIQT